MSRRRRRDYAFDVGDEAIVTWLAADNFWRVSHVEVFERYITGARHWKHLRTFNAMSMNRSEGRQEAHRISESLGLPVLLDVLPGSAVLSKADMTMRMMTE